MIRLCHIDEIAANSARGFTIAGGSGPVKIFIVNSNHEFHAYENRCPHTGVNLDWRADQFLDNSNTLIQCATHGALFRIVDGYCIYGPCANQSLTAVRLDITDGILSIVA